MFSTKARSAVLALAVVVALSLPLAAQRTALRTGSNSFTTQQDIEMGRALSQDAERTLTLSTDSAARGYIRTLGSELAGRAPGYRYPYEFRVFVDPDIRTMALPGGIIYVSSGLVAAMQNEPQLASVLAHQIGHVAARHGTQQVSAEYSRLNRQARASVTDAISRLNLRADSDSVVTRYNSQAELQADTIATQILYDTRFDPRQIPAAFQTLVDQRISGARDFTFNHPTPQNRTASIRRELQRLGPLPGSWRGDSAAFRTAQQNLRSDSSFGLARSDDRNTVPPPSSRWTTFQGVDFEIRYPDNWTVDENAGNAILAPAGGTVSGDLAYGMMIDTFQPEIRSIFGRSDLVQPGQSFNPTNVSIATDQLIDELRRSNPNIREIRRSARRVAGYEAMTVELNNDSPVGGTEVDRLTAILHSNGQLYYFLGVAPQNDDRVYSPIFDRMIASIRFY
jgi:hypothetical protein